MNPEPATPAPCCPLWEGGFKAISEAILMAQVHGSVLSTRAFSFCPWCGRPFKINKIHDFTVGDQVFKPNGYHFDGVVVAVFTTVAGLKRYVVDNEDGLLHIFSGNQIARNDTIPKPKEPPCPLEPPTKES